MFRLPTAGSRRRLLLLPAVLVGLGLIAWALPQTAPGLGARAVKPAPEEPVELVDHMHVMKKQLKALAQGLQAGKPDAELLGYVTAMQREVLEAKALDPSNLDEQPEARRDAHKRAFRADLARLLIELANLEIDLLEGRSEEAFGRVTGALFKLRESSHDKYQKP